MAKKNNNQNDEIYCFECGYKGYAVAEEESYALFDDIGQPNEKGPKYIEKIAYCPECRSLIYVPKISKENGMREDNAIREFFNLVSYEDLLKLPRKYAMSRKNISDVLGFEAWLNEPGSENVIYTSIWDGEPPTSDESDAIREALNNPKYFLEKLDKAKDKIDKEKYEKTRKRVLEMIERISR